MSILIYNRGFSGRFSERQLHSRRHSVRARARKHFILALNVVRIRNHAKKILSRVSVFHFSVYKLSARLQRIVPYLAFFVCKNRHLKRKFSLTECGLISHREFHNFLRWNDFDKRFVLLSAYPREGNGGHF